MLESSVKKLERTDGLFTWREKHPRRRCIPASYVFCIQSTCRRMQKVVLNNSARIFLGGGGGTVGSLRRFGLKTGEDFAHFGVESGMVYEGGTVAYQCDRRFNSN